MKKCRENCLESKKGMLCAFITIIFLLVVSVGYSQDGNTGINEANTKVRSYFDSGTNLMYAVGALVGLIGAVKV